MQLWKKIYLGGLYTELKAIIRDSGNIKLANLKRETFHNFLVVYFHNIFHNTRSFGHINIKDEWL